MSMRDLEIRHKPVLPDAVLEVLRPVPGKVLVDCTLGLGGHSRLLLPRVTPGGRVVGIDFDTTSLAIVRGELAGGPGQLDLCHNNFAGLATVLAELGIEKVDGILADLGVSSPQIDDPSRGFSYRKPGPLDMRMDRGRAESAMTLIARLSEAELRDAILDYGDETDAPAIARAIVDRRKVRPITTTEDLSEIICTARDFTMQRAAGAKLHPAARTFQAIRMLVNREPQNLDRLLAVAPTVLQPGGRIAVISFHSGEDRRVKQSFRDGRRSGIYSAIGDDPITATEAEQRANPRSRSAKLRWAGV